MIIQKNLENIIKDSIIRLVKESLSHKNIKKQHNKHQEKIHFIPIQYRIIGGILQSLNIKFGNFLQNLLSEIILTEKKLILHELSGKKISSSFSKEVNNIIEEYIYDRENNATTEEELSLNFNKLKENIINQNKINHATIHFKQDIDLLFETENQIVYLEIKYNDDHDTGKFADINRKFIKTFLLIQNHVASSSTKTIVPIIYYFNKKIRWQSHYIPKENVLRGKQLFDKYFSMKFDELENGLLNISNNPDIIKIFDDLINNVKNLNNTIST